MQKPNKTLGPLFLKKVNDFPNQNAIGWIEKNKVLHIKNSKYKRIVEETCLGLLHIGMEAEDKVSILSTTCKEWHFCDMAVLCGNGATIPVYPSYLAEEVEYILNHSESKIIFVENDSQFNKILEIQDKLPYLTAIISLQKILKPSIPKLNKKISYYHLTELIKLGAAKKQDSPELFEQTLSQTTEDQIATIIYTSGTTGEPKGAVITHGAFFTMLSNLKDFLKTNLDNNDKTLTFLPLSHVLGRCDSMLNIVFNLENIYAESIDTILENLSLVQPTVMIAVPRIFEKVYAKVSKTISDSNTIKKSLFDWAQAASNQYFDKLDRDLAPSSFEILQRELAYKIIFSKIYKRFGGNIRFFVSGGAPLSPEIAKFLRNANLTILEGYGLTETVAPCVLSPPSKQTPGTVGVPIGDVQLKFADDGEIMIKTKALLSEYYKNKAATQEVFSDGWFLSGDIGELTNSGFLLITDRKKDIIITSAGKNVAPQKIENLMKTKSYISNFMVVGDQQKYLTAVVAIELDTFKDQLSELGISEKASLEDISKNKKIYKLIEDNIKEANKELASFETIKKFYIAPTEFSLESGFVTPSLKLKKKVINKAYKSEIDALYN